MRISDWSSDVCSSDAGLRSADAVGDGARLDRRRVGRAAARGGAAARHSLSADRDGDGDRGRPTRRALAAGLAGADLVAGDRGDRKSVGWGKSVSVRVDVGGRRIIKKKKQKK